MRRARIESIAAGARDKLVAAVRAHPNAARFPRLTGLCAVAADLAIRRIGEAGGRAELVIGTFTAGRFQGPHAWGDVEGWLVDIAGAQFAAGGVFLPRVLVVRDDARYREAKRGDAAAREIRQRWPRAQWPETWRGRLP